MKNIDKIVLKSEKQSVKTQLLINGERWLHPTSYILRKSGSMGSWSLILGWSVGLV